MREAGKQCDGKPHLWLIALVGVLVPRRLRADWRQEWEAELRYRELLLAEWDRLTWQTKLDLLRRSLGAFIDALLLQPKRLEDEMFQDLSFGARMLLKHRNFTLFAVLSLALGIGANTAIFSVVNALLLRPLPYPQPERLVKLYLSAAAPGKFLMRDFWAYPRLAFLREHNQSFAEVAGYANRAYNLTGTDEPAQLRVEFVSAGYFHLLGVEPAAGRTFTPEEDQPESAAAAVIGYGLWQRRFGGDAGVIGRTVELEKRPFTVVGVLPPGFRGQDGAAELWLPLTAASKLMSNRILTNPNQYWIYVIARLKPGVSLGQAQSEMGIVGESMAQAIPDPPGSKVAGKTIIQPVPLREANVDLAVKKSFLILLAAVGFVLLIACANTANLLLARAVARRKEFAVRLALGAPRGRIVRQLLTESTLLALLGGVLGLLLALWGARLLSDYQPSDGSQFWTSYARMLKVAGIRLDAPVLAFNFLLAAASGILFGLLPAWQASRADLNEALKDGAGAALAGPRLTRRLRSRSLLVISEIALSVVLLVGAGLMIKSLQRLQAVNLGFEPRGVITMAARGRGLQPEFYERLLARVQALPGVEAASVGSTAPLLGYASQTPLHVEGRPESDNIDQPMVGVNSVSPDFFKTLRISLLKGRQFNDADRAGAPRVAIISQSAAERFFPGEEPLGKRIQVSITDDKDPIEIVGLVGNVKYGRLEEVGAPAVYLPYLQPGDSSSVLIVRSNVAPSSLVAAIRREVLALDKNVPLTGVQTMAERSAEVTSRTRFIAALLAVFAGLALLLAGVGIYGVMAYSVSARTRELGIRIALGAQAGDLLRLVLREGARLVVVGLALGLLAAWASLRVLQSQLYDVSATDPLTFGGVALLLAGVALAACYVPARKAMQTDPLAALRYE